MSAFLDLLNAYAIWLYIVGAVGILFGIKSLVDSRRQARTTLFTLEQEQAHDRAFRAVLIMVVFALLIVAVSAINTFISPGRPVQQAATITETEASYTPPVVLPTITPVPTLTVVPPPTLTEVPPSPTRAAAPPTAAPPPSAPTAVPPVKPTQQPSAPPSGSSYPAPAPWNPTDGSVVTSGFVHFRWDSAPLPANLPPGQQYKLAVSYTDRDSNQHITREMCSSSSNFQARANTWPDLANAQGRAVNDLFSWTVVVVQVTNPNGWCGDGTPLSPPSPTMTFKWVGG